jgi:serine/threonine-protein kinase
MPSTSIDITGCWTPPPAETDRLMAGFAADLGGRYRLCGYLGRGGFATVWRADDAVAGVPVAIKRFESSDPRNGGFYRELAALFRLSHPRIVGILNLLEAPGARYLILEYCPGGSLRSPLGRARRAGTGFAVSTVARLGIQVAEGLAAAHRLGLVHRDVKPENVLLAERDGRPAPDDPDLAPDDPAADPSADPDASEFDRQLARFDFKLADFGLARALRPDRGDAGLRKLSGSPIYMAPEQFSGGFGPASDVYALGVILFEMLHGRPPFEGDPGRLAAAHLAQPPRPDPRLGPDCCGVLLRMLAKAPADRPTADEVIAALRRLAEPAPPAEPGPPSEPGPPAEPAPPDAAVPPSASAEPPEPGWIPVDPSARDLLPAVGDGGPVVVAPEALTELTAGGPVRLAHPGLTCAARGPDGSLWAAAGARLLAADRRGGPPTLRAVLTASAAIERILPPAAADQPLVLVVAGRLTAHRPGEASPWWTVPLRCHGLPTAAVRLADGSTVVAEGPSRPRLTVIAPTGAAAAEIPLPGPCFGLTAWLGGGGLFAKVLADSAMGGYGVEPTSATLRPLPGAEDCVLFAVGPSGAGPLFGLPADGRIRAWDDASAAPRTAAGVGDGGVPRAFGAAGAGRLAVLTWTDTGPGVRVVAIG